MTQQQPRIITGKFKGIRLQVPDGARPITDRIKTSVFDILQGRVEGAKVLDLHAGSGTMGLEALSRGAVSAIFVDSSEKSVSALRSNVLAVQATSQAQIWGSSVGSALAKLSETEDKFDLIFADPPFEQASKFDVDQVAEVLSPEGLFMFRRPAEYKYSTKMQLVYSGEYGGSVVDFLSI